MNQESKEQIQHAVETTRRAIGTAAIFSYRNILRPASVSTYRHILHPTARLVDRELSKPMPQMSRRTFLGVMGLSVAAGVATGLVVYEKAQQTEVADPTTQTPTGGVTPVAIPAAPQRVEATATIVANPEKKVINPKFYEPFDDKSTNEIAKQLGIDAGSFFKIPEKLLPQLRAFLGKELFPIYSPAVFQYKDLIYKLADKNNIPPNIVASIISIESAGRKDAKSGVGAMGLMQVMPYHFNNRGIYDEETMLDPETNIQFGIDVIKDFINLSRQKYGQNNPNHPLVYVRALMGYNGGGDAVENESPTSTARAEGALLTPEESAFYGDHMIRFIVTAELASKLREKGLNDQEIITKLSSDEIAARAYALGAFHVRSMPYLYSYYDEFIHDLAREVPWEAQGSDLSPEVRTLMKKDYDEYFSSTRVRLPAWLPQSLRIWIALNGKGLFEQEAKNTDPEAWRKINSRRN